MGFTSSLAGVFLTADFTGDYLAGEVLAASLAGVYFLADLTTDFGLDSDFTAELGFASDFAADLGFWVECFSDFLADAFLGEGDYSFGVAERPRASSSCISASESTT